MTTQQSAGFDPRAFRRALGNFATGVTIVTAAVGQRRVGVTANSFNSVSLDPALILWSIDKRSTSHAVFNDAGHFAVNVLAVDQVELSNRFARAAEDKFAGIDFTAGAGGAPLLEGCAARFQCQLLQQVEGGDHWILIGRVLAFDDLGRSPLLYHQGAYASVLPHPRPVADGERAGRGIGGQGRLGDNLYYLMTQALRGYQTDYQPRQLATGLRTGEARLLLVLAGDCALERHALQREVAMPNREIDLSLDLLRRKGLVEDAGDGYMALTAAGREQAERLWTLAAEQQARVFAGCSPEQLSLFRDLLRRVAGLR